MTDTITPDTLILNGGSRRRSWIGWCRRALLALALLVLPASVPGHADMGDNPCFGGDFVRRIEACTALIEGGGLAPGDLAAAYSARALAHSVRGSYDLAIPDYDRSLEVDPGSAVALNNRAWAYYKIGEPERGYPDVERALALMPDSPHALDTRAHIRQSRGDIRGAMRDYEMAMRYGGEHIVKLYQCGLQAQSLFEGEIDGIYTSTMRTAMETCVATTGCDPLPPDEECVRVTS